MHDDILETLIDRYNKVSFAHNYILGFCDNGRIYACITDENILSSVCKIDRGSRNGGNSLRFIPTKKQKAILKTLNPFFVCTTDDFNSKLQLFKYNRGELFEKLITEFFGQVWYKDYIPFTQAGDIVINDTPYQIKFQYATFVTEGTLSRLSA